MVALATSKLTEFQFRNSLTHSFPLTSYSHSHSLSLLLFSSQKTPSYHLLKPFSSLRTNQNPNKPDHRLLKPRSPSSAAPWLNKWPSPSPPIDKTPEKVSQSNGDNQFEDKKQRESESQTRYLSNTDKGQNAIERIVLRLRNLGLGSDDEDEEEEGEEDGLDSMPVTGEEKLEDLLKREWARPNAVFLDEMNEAEDEWMLPWEREEKEREEGKVVGMKRRTVVKAPTLAELTIEDEELRRLRRMGMHLRERINVPKAGITQAVLEKIHDNWRKNELVRLKFHEFLATDMKTAHEVVERRTAGLVIWRSGSVMVVYRGSNYGGPSSKSQPVEREGDALFVPDVSSADGAALRSVNGATSTSEKSEPAVRIADHTKTMTEEEAEFNSLLDSLGPRFQEWWGTGMLPVDADLLPQKIPGYKTPFRVLPTGMRSRLTNAEMTDLRKLARKIPSHFALGRNRNHQGLAAAIIKLWEKTLVAKIAVKRGIQNTNNKLMAEELKSLTGGTLLLRNKYYIVIFRGKDFLPTSVAAALAEREEFAKQIQDVEEKVRNKVLEVTPSGENEVPAPAGSLAEFYEAQSRWGREVSTEERERMMEEAAKAKHARLVKRIEHKLAVAQAKKLRAEKLLAKIEASMVPSGPDYDQETITDEERIMFRRVGLKMKAYLPLGIRGVFDGVIENMHLHWKYRELVKLISKQKTLAFVEDTARLLEYESGGILVAIERVPKGFAIIYYRGKNYRRPISLRPRNLLTKAKALKRSVAMQRHEALSQHISELESTIEQMRKEIGVSLDVQDGNAGSSEVHGQFDQMSELSESEDEVAVMESDGDFDSEEDLDWEADEDSEIDQDSLSISC
ncbi:CRM-domain containing factor CFM3, chloroplastic/mitochondrial [Pistacia vera]|uniref:CRM-domain containing factor CFM3, chloroplastic/mitochondrial n=1 Tax=Pistacia vera TaxID=55513 RepID=UPI001263485C|nr:CRM-domain containing factor CFM3, chloroplastic/mitochondrial [Pistacia vera]XP_031259325.1 CRM-domain containing factor CFM3, chloroplastic/mitochondrial [Pistacia vera]